MTSLQKTALKVTGILTSILLFFVFWYNYQYSMGEAISFEVNNPNSPTKLLIATQGSDYKEMVTLEVVSYFKKKNIYIKVIDIKELNEVQSEQWNAICLMHTWEMWKPPYPIEVFVNKQKDKSPLAILTTSGDGKYKMKEVDAITGASVLTETSQQAKLLIERIEHILQQNKNQT